MKTRLLQIIALLALFTLRSAAQSPHPLVDLTFVPADNIQGYGYGPTVVTPGGRIIMGMTYEYWGVDAHGVPQPVYVNEMRALLPDGRVDTAFQPVQGRGPGVIAPNGDFIVAAGPTSSPAPARLVRTDSRGQQIWSTTLPNNPFSSTGATGVLLQKDGRIIVYGMTGIDRYTADGGLDGSFHAVLPIQAEVWSAALQKDGKLLAIRYAGVQGMRFFRLNTDGSEDSSFPARNLPYGSGGALVVLKDGRILAGGPGYAGEPGVYRFLADGTPDNTFAAPPYQASSMVVQEDGRIIIGGYFLGDPVNGRANPALLTRLLPDGALDASFGCPLCDYENEDGQSVHSLTLDPAGNLIANGSFSVPGTNLYGAVRLKTALPRREVQFSLSTQDVQENAGWASVKVVRSGDASARVTVAWATQAGTAKPLLDFIPGAGVLVFRSGETERTVRVRILTDRRREEKETVHLKLWGASAGIAIGAKKQTTLNILDVPPASGGGPR
jgi:uncharacterized delta-60 repeat protein